MLTPILFMINSVVIYPITIIHLMGLSFKIGDNIYKEKKMKSYTDIEQSKKLIEILPLESADMHYATWAILDGEFIVSLNQGSTIKDLQEDYGNQIIPVWSLTALLSILPYPILSKDKLGDGKNGWMVSVYPNNCRYDSCWHDNSVDACYEMVIKLHEIKML